MGFGGGLVHAAGVDSDLAFDVRDYGARGDGVNDDTSGLKKAINAAFDEGGGVVALPEGTYKLTGEVPVKQNVLLRGVGPGATVLQGAGTHAVLRWAGTTGAGVINRGGVEDLTIRGGDNTDPTCIGLDMDYANRCVVRNVILHDCYLGTSFKDCWQVRLDHVHAQGQGADQNHIGFQFEESTGADNAVVMSACYAQDTVSHGFRLKHFAGSKFIGCEAGACGGKGWYLGDPATAVNVEFGHFVDCLADTCTEEGWYLKKGATATDLHGIQLSNCWTGSNSVGLYMEGANEVVIQGLLGKNLTGHGIHVKDSSRCSIGSSLIRDYGMGELGTENGLLLEDSSHNAIAGCNFNDTNGAAGQSVVESGTSDENSIVGCSVPNGLVKVGANSVVLCTNVEAYLPFKFTVNSGGIQLPSMTTTQRNALTAFNGMVIYNTTAGKFQGYENGAWVNLVGAI